MRESPSAGSSGGGAWPWDSQEFQSALIRFPLGGGALLFLLAGDLTDNFTVPWGETAVLYGLHLVIFLVLFGWVVRQPAYHQMRSDISVVADLTAITALIYLAGEPASMPMYLLYVVLFLSQGTRFGRRNLVISAVGGLVCYAGIATFMGAWARDPVQTAFILVALAVLALYQHTLLRSLQRAWRNAEAAKEARGEFLRTMTHELRTPLSGIIGMTRVLERTSLDDEQRRYVGSISSSANTLQALVGDMLDLSKVDAGTLELTEEWFAIRETVTEVCHNLGPQALGKGVELVCHIDDDVPQRVRGDPVRVQQILYNLVGNAVKFTERGRVWIEVNLTEPGSGDRPASVQLRVRDTGMGIPADHVPYVFDSYWQADSTMARRFGGTGLGTTIAYRLARAMGGDIDVNSREGEGTVFSVRLPLLSGDPTADRPPQPPPVLSDRTAIVVEADAHAREAISASCRRAQMSVYDYGACMEVERSALKAADIAIVADTPEGGDLTEALGEMSRPDGQRLPAVYVGYRGRPVPAGVEADAVVAKPFQPLELWHGLATALSSIVGDEARAAEPGGLPVEGYRVLVAEDDAVNAELIQTLLSRTGFDADVVADGQAALDALQDTTYDLALLDLRMPQMGGIEITQRLRSSTRDAGDVALVALSADPSEGTRSACLEAGMDEFLSKPVEPDRLDDLLRRLVPA